MVCYLFNGIWFHFHLCIVGVLREMLLQCGCSFALPPRFGLLMPFRSRISWRHATDRWTVRQTDTQTDTTNHFIMPQTYSGQRHKNKAVTVNSFVTANS